MANLYTFRVADEQGWWCYKEVWASTRSEAEALCVERYPWADEIILIGRN